MKTIFKNIATSILPQVANIAFNLVLPAFIIMKFGSDINGLVTTTKTIVSYIGLVGAGIATAVTQALYLPVAKKDDVLTNGMLKAANKMFNKYGTIYLVITLAVSLIYPYLIDTDLSNINMMILMFVISLSGASEFFLIGRCRALLYAHQKVYICSIIQAISIICSLLFALIMIKLDAGIILVQLSISLIYVLRGLLLYIYIKKCYPQYTNFRKAVPISTVTSKKNDAMIHQLAGLVVTGSQAIVLTFLVGLEAASIYAVYNIVIAGIKMICANICTAITPFLGKKYALNEIEKLKDIYSVFECILFFGFSLILVVTVVLILPFVELYTRNADINYIYWEFAFLSVLSSAFYILKLPGTALINVAGHFKETKYRAIIEASLCLILNIVCTFIFGMSGVLVGTGIALLWRCIDTIIYSNRNILGEKSTKSFLRLILVVFNIIFAGFVSLHMNIEINDYYSWIIYAVIVFMVIFVLISIELIIFEKKSIKLVVRYLR